MARKHEALGCMIATVFGLVLLIVLFVCYHTFNSIDCHLKTREMTIESRYTIWNGCQVQDTQLGWVNYDRLRAVGE